MKWTPDLATGYMEIDKAHQGLMETLDRFKELSPGPMERENQQEVIGELMDYAVRHFDQEEALFQQYQYPDRERHVEEHELFLDKILDFYNDLRHEKSNLTRDMIVFLESWIIRHIKETDMRYVRYFKEKGIESLMPGR